MIFFVETNTAASGSAASLPLARQWIIQEASIEPSVSAPVALHVVSVEVNEDGFCRHCIENFHDLDLVHAGMVVKMHCSNHRLPPVP